MKINEICENIFVINLDRRVDRLQNFIEESEKHSFDFTKISAIDGQTIENNTALRDGEVGLLRTYSALIKFAQREQLSSILVCEDDVVFEDDLEIRLDNEWPEIPSDADLVFLGANHRNLGAGMWPPEQISEHVLRVYSSLGMHCHLIKDTVYDLVLQLIERMNFPLDVVYCYIQQCKDFKAYGFMKNLCKQRDGMSDILLFDPQYNKAGIFD